jgi:hypothetical protein
LLGDVGLIVRPTGSFYNEAETAISIAAQVPLTAADCYHVFVPVKRDERKKAKDCCSSCIGIALLNEAYLP